MSIIKVMLILSIAVIVIAYSVTDFFKQYMEVNIPVINLTMWAPSDVTDVEMTRSMYVGMLEEFHADYPQVTINLEIIAEDEYHKKLLDAFENGNPPDLFDSTCLSNSEYSYLEDLDGIFSLSGFDPKLYFFIDDYERYFPYKNQIPLTFNIPFLYKNSVLDIDEITGDYESFINNKTNYIGTFDDYDKVQIDMAGSYEICEPELRFGRGNYGNIWSVSIFSDKKRKYAAERVIYYLLSDSSQEILTVENHSGFPVNRDVWNEFIEINPDFESFTDHIDGYVMEDK